MSCRTEIAWSNTATYVSSGFTTNPTYAVTEYKKQIAEQTSGYGYYEVSFDGNCIFIGNTDAITVRVVVSNGSSSTTTISADTVLAEDTYYGNSVAVDDSYSLSISDGYSIFLLDGGLVYDSGDVNITDQKLFTFSDQTDATALITFPTVSYLGMVFGGTLTEYGEPEYPLKDDQQDFGFQKRTINGTNLYTPNYISNDISFNMFCTFDEYQTLRTAQRVNRNNVLCYVSDDVTEEYYVKYGFLDLVQGTESRGRYYDVPIKIQGE